MIETLELERLRYAIQSSIDGTAVRLRLIPDVVRDDLNRRLVYRLTTEVLANKTVTHGSVVESPREWVKGLVYSSRLWKLAARVVPLLARLEREHPVRKVPTTTTVYNVCPHLEAPPGHVAHVCFLKGACDEPS